jgi:transposase
MSIIEVLRLQELGLTQREIACSVRCGKTTVGDLRKRCERAGLTYETAKGMTDSAIRALLYPKASGGRPVKPEPDWDAVQKELNKGPRRNLQFVWEAYRRQTPDGLSYSQFCYKYRVWHDTTGADTVMVVEHEPGKELFVDWIGDKLPCVSDRDTGETKDAHFFVSTLGDSGFPYAEAFPEESQMSWLSAHEHAFQYYGGVPLEVVPDNCKTAVTRSSFYDPTINLSYADLARHYGVAVVPARVRAPKDKAQVEGAVGWLETWLLEWLRDQRFGSFAELNQAVRRRLSELVKRPFQKRGGTRESVFLEIDKPCLRPLPVNEYQYREYQSRHVPDNYHVEYQGFYYSVPYRYYRQEVTVRASGTLIEILDREHRLIACHERRYLGKRYVTLREHMPANHQAAADARGRDGESYRAWARNTGEAVFTVIDRLLSEAEVEQTAYRSCMGILQMGKKYGAARLNAACKKAETLGSVTYPTIRTILKNGQDGQDGPTQSGPAMTIPVAAHANIRGAAEFR